MIVLNVYYKAKRGMREEFFEAVMTAGVPDASRAEEGNIKYDYYFSEADDDELLLVEHWRDEAAFELHKAQEHFKSLGPIKDEYLVDTRIDRFDV